MSEPKILPAWLDADAAALAGAEPPAQTLAGALPGLARAQSLAPVQRLQRVRESGLAESSGAGESVALVWRQFLRGHGPSALVIDATGLDVRARGSAAVLDGAPWLLAEGLAIAAGLRDSRTVELRLPAELSGHEAAFRNAADAIRSLAQVSTPRMQVEVRRDSRPGYWGEEQPSDGSRLIHTPETWCRIALLFAGESDLDALLFTLRRGMKQRGLVELARSGNLRSQIDAWGGGVEASGDDAVLVFDDGLGGFLPLAEADLACDPLSFASVGIVPAPSSLMVMAEGVCVVKQTRRALYRHWQLADGIVPAPVRPLLARAARLTAEITLGRGEPGHLVTLDEVALELAAQGLAAAWTLRSSLRYYREQWEQHTRRESCPEGLCLVRNPAPCHGTCPANIDIPSFMAHLGHGDYRATIEVIRRDNPLPLTCGLICPAPCESACVRGGSNGAVFIRPLKAKAAEHCLADGGYPQPELAPDTGKRIGIVGSGPSSLTAAYYLRTYGHQVEIFEELEHAGGQLRYGIPAYRLPPDLLDQEIEQIRVLGVQIHTNATVDSLEAFRKDFDAVYLGLGTQKARLLPVEGSHLPIVLGGIEFLHAVRSNEPVRVGPRVVVIGGGNVSIDVALTALRQGAQHVDLTAIDQRRNMAASPHDIEMAVSEGVQLHPGWGPIKIDEDGGVTFQLCEQTHDADGKFDPKYDPTRLLTLEADHVIMATGQGTDMAILDGSDVEQYHHGFIVADSQTLMTKEPGVFAGGDAQHGPRLVVDAIRSGKIAAAAIDAWLRGTPMDADIGKPVCRDDVSPLPVLAQDRTYRPRAVMPERSVEEVLGEGNYVQVEKGLTDAMADDEVRRCLRCDVCIGCGLCMAACSEMGIDALRMADTTAPRLAYFDFTESEACIGCGACTQVCPTGAIHLEDRDGKRRTVITGTVVKEQPLLTCSECGAPTQTPAHREYVRRRLPDHMAALLERELCQTCARGRGDRPHVGATPRVAASESIPQFNTPIKQ